MLPEIKLQDDIDVAALSPLLRGMLLSVSYADGEGGIGLTATGAMNRKFVHWAAVHFRWPGFTAEDLYSMHKVLNENDVPPLWIVHDMTRYLKLLGGGTRTARNRTLRPNGVGTSCCTESSAR